MPAASPARGGRATADDQGTNVVHLTATVNDVVYCLQELQGQVETLRQHVLHMRVIEEGHCLMDAEIQTLKAGVQSLKDAEKKRESKRGDYEGQFFNIKLLVRDLDTTRAAEIESLTDVVQKLAGLDKERPASPARDLQALYTHEAAPQVSQPELTAQQRRASRRMSSTSESAGWHKAVRAGTILVCNPPEGDHERDADIFEAVDSHEILRIIHEGEQVVATGTAVEVDGHDMVPIEPSGAIELDFFHILRPGEEAPDALREKMASQMQDMENVIASLPAAGASPAERTAKPKKKKPAWLPQSQNSLGPKDTLLPPTPQARKQTSAMHSAAPLDRSLLELSRTELLSAVFHAFDANATGALEEAEMLEFMKARGGFRGSDSDWTKEYNDMSLEGGWTAATGINATTFGELVSDTTNMEYYCNDQRLTAIALAVMKADLQAIETAEQLRDEVHCPSCQEVVQISMARCANCRHILQWSKKDEASLLTERMQETVRPDAKLLEVIAGDDAPGAIAIIASVAISDLNAMDDLGASALHMAAERGQVSVCHALLARHEFDHADAKDWYFGSTALHLASSSGHPEVVLALLNHPRFSEENGRNSEGNTALHNAAKQGHADVCLTLLDHPDFTDANVTNFDGYTALHLAALHAHVDVCRVLVEHFKFTNVNEKSKWGTNAACIAQGGARVALSNFRDL